MKATLSRIVTHLTYRPHRLTTVGGISMTVPDMTLSIHEILVRWTRNQTIPGGTAVNINGDLSELDSMTEFELIDLKRANDRKILRLKADLALSDAKRKEADAEKRFNERLESEIAKRSVAPITSV